MPFVRNAWYCMAFTSEVGAGPIGRTLLDEPLVLFRKADGAPTVMSDVCPHRFAPLHMGLLVDHVLYCPYHGLGFDSSGACVHNPHGSGRIPPLSALRVYPVAETQGVVWVWMGDPAQADPAKIVDLRLIGGPEDPRVSSHLTMNAEYRLVIDNLLDLNHAPYLHSGTLSPVGTTRETRSDRGADTAASHYLMRSVPTPASQQLWFDEPVGDYHVSIDWTAPSTFRQRNSMTRAGAPVEEGAIMRIAHLLTPETAATTHYFWIVTRNRLIGDEQVDAAIRGFITNAFLTEDGPMMEACQKNMRGREFAELKPIFLETDAATGHARAILDKLISAEASHA